MARNVSRMDTLAQLLAMADNPASTPEEAATAMDRALRMASAMSVDLAVARAHQKTKEREQPEKRRTKVGTPGKNGNDALMDLFTNIAMANDLKVTIQGEHYTRGGGFERQRWDPNTGEYIDEYVSGTRLAPSIYCNAYGFPSDHEVTEKIYAVASTQMVSQADKAIRAGAHKADGISAKTWRQEFYIGFNGRLNGRLWAAKREAEAAAGVDSNESEGTALILRNKKEEVEDFYKEDNKRFYRADGEQRKNVASFKGTKSSGHSYDARTRGQEAAERVNLAGEARNLAGASRTAVGGSR